MAESAEPLYTRRVADALAFAAETHSHQRRKGKDEPYLSHVLMVTALVAHYGGDEDQIVAACLHDAVEDQGGSVMLNEIRDRFGEHVSSIVLECSDSLTSKDQAKAPWRERKQAYLTRLQGPDRTGARLVEACDKLANLRDIVEDLRSAGPATLDRFSGGADGVRWYYTQLRDVLMADFPVMVDEYAGLLHQLVPANPDHG